MTTALAAADGALSTLNAMVGMLPDPELLVFMHVRKEAVLSSQIEGKQSSLQDLLAVEAQVLDPDRPKDVGEVLNYVIAMNHGLRRVATLPVSIRLVREIHRLLLDGVRGSERTPGELRRTQNWIGLTGGRFEDAVFVPPPPDAVPGALGEWETFLHTDHGLPPLLQVGLAHAQFETIHPFLDGNGRVGRHLIVFLLCERGALTEPVLYLSHFFRAHQGAYYDRLQGVRDEGDWEAWLLFFLHGVAGVAQEAAVTIRRIAELREVHRARVTEQFGRVAAKGLRVLDSLFTRPIITVRAASDLTGTSFEAANNLIARFVEQGILEEITGYRRNRRFRYNTYIQLFSDEP
jgi:Fic family protein